MKTTLLLLCMSLPILAQSQCDSLNLDDRRVINHTAHLWKHNYDKIIGDSLIGNHLEEDSLVLSYETYHEYFDDKYIANSIHFWYYLDSSNILRIAIQTGSDSFIVFVDKKWMPKERESLSKHLTDWYNYAHNQEKPFIYVEQYQFDKSYIDGLFRLEKNIIVENVVHSVSADSRRYDLRDIYKNENADSIEGFLTFDILLMALGENGEKRETDFYNFAKPCPKICNTPIFKK